MINRRRLLVIGLVAYTLFAIGTFPARIAYRLFAPDAVVAAGLDGSVWNGQASAVGIGDLLLQATSWKAQPISLFVGRFAFEVDARHANGRVRGRLAVSPFGATHINELAGVMPLSAFASLVPGASLDGRIGLDLDHVKLSHGWPVEATGTVDLVDVLVVSPAVEPLGNYSISFQGAGDNGLQGTITDTSGPLAVEGSILLLADRRWEVDATVTPRQEAAQTLVAGLALLGPRDGQGRIPVRFAGQLDPQG